MGKIILCSGVRTNRPYVFQTTGIRIFSIEELCWYLNHYVYFIDEDMFGNSLLDFLDQDLKLSERADKIRQLKKQGADLKTIVTAVMCSSDYYSENEIKDMIKTLDRIIGMPPIIRNYIKANNYLKNNQYSEAAVEYKRILYSKDAIDLTPEQYGDIYHNLGVATVHMKGAADAAEFFRQAYERNLREESLQQYLYAIKLSENMEIFDEKLKRYQVSNEISEHLLNNIRLSEEKAEESEKMADIRRMKQLKAEGKISEFYKLADEIIDEWKASMRQVSYGNE